MIDRHQRLFVDQRDRLGGGQAHNDAADQPRPRRRCDPVDGFECSPGIRHRLADDVIERLDVRARRDLRHDAAEGGMFIDLREHDIG